MVGNERASVCVRSHQTHKLGRPQDKRRASYAIEDRPFKGSTIRIHHKSFETYRLWMTGHCKLTSHTAVVLEQRVRVGGYALGQVYNVPGSLGVQYQTACVIAQWFDGSSNAVVESDS